MRRVAILDACPVPSEEREKHDFMTENTSCTLRVLDRKRQKTDRDETLERKRLGRNDLMYDGNWKNSWACH